MGLTYARDVARRITGVASVTDAREIWAYTEDDLDRLTAATNSGDATLSQTFQYDLAGNLTYNSKLGIYTYPAATAPRPHAPLTASSRAFTYDANGNNSTDTRSGTLYAYTYNQNNRLTTITSASNLKATYTYDAMEHLAIRVLTNMTPSGTIHTVYDRVGNLLI